MWVIDVIRAGLVEGKLSQLNKQFLIHRCTYRTFGKHQWEEVGSRLETWKVSLKNVLEVVKAAREQVDSMEGSNEVEASGGRGQQQGRKIQTVADGVAM